MSAPLSAHSSVEQLNDPADHASKIVEYFNNWLANDSPRLVERYLRGQVKLALRCRPSLDQQQYGFVIGRANTPIPGHTEVALRDASNSEALGFCLDRNQAARTVRRR